jgi:cytidine deaminase
MYGVSEGGYTSDRVNAFPGGDAGRTHLARFPRPARERLEAVLVDRGFDGVVEAEVLDDLRRLGSATAERLLVDLSAVASLFSMSATSGFHVGAVCEGLSGNAYFGANLEVDGAPVGFTVHAEQSAVANALAHREKAILRLAVTAAPCGHCRQFLNELATASELHLIIGENAATTLAALLPEPFGPADLGVEGGLIGSTETPLALHAGADDALADAALRAASLSYAPYTQAHSGVAFRLRSGTIVVGSYIENAAFNPSLPPVLTAIDRLRFVTRTSSDVTEAVLVELDGAKISQEALSRMLLDTIAPGAVLRLVRASRLAK